MEPVLLTGPLATPEGVAELLGVSKTRLKRLMRWALEDSRQERSSNGKQVQDRVTRASGKTAKKTR